MKIYSNMGNLGDNLWLTPILLSVQNPVLNTLDHPRMETLIPIFDGLCDIRPQKEVNSYVFDNNSHAIEQIANQIGITLKTYIPKIILKEEEIKWAKEFLKDYKNPIVIINDNIGANDPKNFAALYRRPPQNYIQEIVNVLKEENTFIQFGLPNGFSGIKHQIFTPIEGAIHILGLSIRQLAACYSVIGLYIGGDTGDYHLMIAAGGKSIVLIPPNNENLGYQYKKLLYKDFFWNEPPRVKYFKHNFESKLKLDFFNLL